MRKIISLLLAVMLMAACLCMPVMAEEETAISVLLDGEYIAFDVAPVIIDGRTMVPVRAIFEALGATVDWQQETQTVISSKGDTDISLKINDTSLYKNGETITLDVPAQLIENRTLVPVRAISEAYGCYVDWNEWTKTVLIISDLDTIAVATVNGEAITAGYCNYILTQMESNVMQNMGLQPADFKNAWTSDIGGITVGEYIVNMAYGQCVFTKSNAQKARAEGIVLTDADKQNIDALVKTVLAVYGEENADLLKLAGLTVNSIREFYTDNMYVEKYANKLLEETISDEEAKEYLEQNYVKAKHILISTLDMTTGMPLPDDEIAAKKKLAEQILAKIRTGSNFDKLIAEYGEDPGMEQNPEGYLFTDGEMIEEFETAVKNLGVGEVSGIVESVYGFHIIKRVANGTYTEQEINQVKTLFADSVYDVLNSNMDAAVITQKSEFFSQVVPLSN